MFALQAKSCQLKSDRLHMEMVSNITETFINILLSSPLDQFGDDDDLALNIFDSLWLGVLPVASYIENLLNWIGFTDLGDIEDWISLIFISTISFIFDDEDIDTGEFEEIDDTISSLQSNIFISNALGMIPGSETITSDATVTFSLSIAIMISVILVGITIHNIRFFSVIYPTGTPIIMAPFIIIIELISYLARAVSLGMRLFANMFAGHSSVKILMSFAWIFINSIMPIIGIPVLILIIAIFFMEIGIAYLQSYLFGALIGMYFEDAIALGH